MVVQTDGVLPCAESKEGSKATIDQAVESVEREGETPSGWGRDGVSVLLAGPWLPDGKGEVQALHFIYCVPDL